MSTLALMRWLESAPDRYDWGMIALTLGRVRELHRAIATAAVRSAGTRVLEIGCGTGTVTWLMAELGAIVTGVDQNPQMLEIARQRLTKYAGIEFVEQTAAEIDSFGDGAFDAVVASLSLSEMSSDERIYVFQQARKLLADNGVLVVGDEVIARPYWARVLQFVLRLPQALMGWILVGSVSRPSAICPANYIALASKYGKNGSS